MNKIALIIVREFLTRIRKRSFLVVTIVVPLVIAGFYALLFYFLLNKDKFGDAKKVEVMDESGFYKNALHDKSNLHFAFVHGEVARVKKGLSNSGYDFLLVIPPMASGSLGQRNDKVQLFSEKPIDMMTAANITDQLNDILKNRALKQAGIDTAILNRLGSSINLETKLLTTAGEKDENSAALYGAGFFFSFLIYFFILIYGAQVMRSVLEEKTSRVVEMIVSSVRPFQLMLGKIVGIALVGLTQFLIWIVLSITAIVFISAAYGVNHTETQKPKSIQAVHPQSSENPAANVLEALESINFPVLIGSFLFYFVTGFLLYGALFAAIGAAVDSETETQQFMFPITIPLIFAFIFSTNFIVHQPNSPLSGWMSMIPFFAPITMMVRIPFNPPVWQVAVSMLLMVLGFLFTTWLAGRIYRTGILMYGKKINFKELSKWLFYKG